MRGRKEKPREFQVVLSDADRRWGDKHRPTWCSDKTCSMIVGWTTSIGWCCGILDNRADLDIVSLCHTLPNEDRQVEDIARILMKPTEALQLSQDLSHTCYHVLDHNPPYRIDVDRLHKKNLKRAERARKKLNTSKGSKEVTEMRIPNTEEVTICDTCSRMHEEPLIARRHCYKYGHILRECVIVTKKQLEHIKEKSHD